MRAACKLWKQICFSMFPILKPTFGCQFEPLDVMPYQLATYIFNCTPWLNGKGLLPFASRTLQAHERNYGMTELEALGVTLPVWPQMYDIHWSQGSAVSTELFIPHGNWQGGVWLYRILTYRFSTSQGSIMPMLMPSHVSHSVCSCGFQATKCCGSSDRHQCSCKEWGTQPYFGREADSRPWACLETEHSSEMKHKHSVLYWPPTGTMRWWMTSYPFGTRQDHPYHSPYHRPRRVVSWSAPGPLWWGRECWQDSQPILTLLFVGKYEK